MTSAPPEDGYLELERRGQWQEALDKLETSVPPGEMEGHRRRIEAKQKLFARMSQVVRTAGGESFLAEQGGAVATRGKTRIELCELAREVDLALVFRTVDDVRADFERRFGAVETEVLIRVYPSRSRLDDRFHQSVLGTPDWAAGVYDGALRLFISRNAPLPPHAIACLVGHELIHLLVDRLGEGRCPRWLDEGLAITLSQQLPPSFQRVLDEALELESHLPLELLCAPFEGLGETRLVDLAYAQAHSVTTYLISLLRDDGIARLLRRFGEMEPDQALAEEALSFWLLERGWLRAQRRAPEG